MYFTSHNKSFSSCRSVVQVSAAQRGSGEPPRRRCVSTAGLLWKHDHWQHVLRRASGLEPRCLRGIHDKSKLDQVSLPVGWFPLTPLVSFPTGRLGGASGVRGRRQALPVRGDQLGRRLREGVSPRRLHPSDQLQPMDRREDGAVVHRVWIHVSSEVTFKRRTWTVPLVLSRASGNILHFLSNPKLLS